MCSLTLRNAIIQSGVATAKNTLSSSLRCYSPGNANTSAPHELDIPRPLLMFQDLKMMNEPTVNPQSEERRTSPRSSGSCQVWTKESKMAQLSMDLIKLELPHSTLLKLPANPFERCIRWGYGLPILGIHQVWNPSTFARQSQETKSLGTNRSKTW